jgi:primosomal protein N' (replication factor Y)
MFRIEVALPVPLARNFTYVSSVLVEQGKRVRVPFGRRRLIGVVLGPSQEKDLEGIELKEIEAVLDETPILSPKLLKLGFWMSQYYLHPLGEVFKTMLPAAETKTTKETYERLEGISDPFLDHVFKKKAQISANLLKKRLKTWTELEKVESGKKQLKAYIKQGLIKYLKQSESRVKKIKTDYDEVQISVAESLPALNVDQEKICETLFKALNTSQCFLLHGVTGSGKTRVYIETMQRYFAEFGKEAQALVLVPEIALTPQMTQVFENSFPGLVAVVHSALSNSQRWAELCKIREGKARVLIGPRSAVFANFQNLKLMVVDEEHDQSYKQSSGLTYNGRDLAVVRAHVEGVNCILGSATPSLESFWNANQEKYKLLELQTRVIEQVLPNIQVIAPERRVQRELLQNETQKLDDSFLSSQALEALKNNLEKGQQAIVLVNRRGYAYYLFDEETKAPIECPACSISLTVHKKRSVLICHYCGYQRSVAELLSLHPKSQFTAIGIGSQKAEVILKQQLPHAKIGRLDSDTLTSRETLFPLLASFRKGEIDILVGTQILAKGHDFPNVGLTVICELDQMLDLPDFRAGERAFQLIVQAAGRAGRSSKGGKVIIQSLRDRHPVIQYASNHDYKGFALDEIKLRRNYAYPPFHHLIRIEISDVSIEKLDLFCTKITQWQKALCVKKPELLNKARMLGPMSPPIERINSRFRRTLLFSSVHLEIVHRLAYDFLASFPLRRGDMRIQVDVDPQSLM